MRSFCKGLGLIYLFDLYRRGAEGKGVRVRGNGGKGTIRTGNTTRAVVRGVLHRRMQQMGATPTAYLHQAYRARDCLHLFGVRRVVTQSHEHAMQRAMGQLWRAFGAVSEGAARARDGTGGRGEGAAKWVLALVM